MDWFRNLARPTGAELEIVRRLGEAKGLHVLPKRWIDERTLAWLVKSRRLARDYETRPEASQAYIYLAMIRLVAPKQLFALKSDQKVECCQIINDRL